MQKQCVIGAGDFVWRECEGKTEMSLEGGEELYMVDNGGKQAV